MKITLKAARVNTGLGRDEAAERLGINVKTLAKYEAGSTYPRVDVVRRIQELYHVHYDDIDFLLPDEPI